MPYRGGTQLWSNRYHFNGGTPADTAAWDTLRAAAVNLDKTVVDSTIHVVAATGYAAGSDVPVYEWAGSVAGTCSAADNTRVPGDCVGLIRYATTARTAKNHPIYLFNYYHGVNTGGFDGGDQADHVNNGWVTAYAALADAWLAGLSDGTHTLVRAGPNGATAISRFVEPLITHRDFPR